MSTVPTSTSALATRYHRSERRGRTANTSSNTPVHNANPSAASVANNPQVAQESDTHRTTSCGE